MTLVGFFGWMFVIGMLMKLAGLGRTPVQGRMERNRPLHRGDQGRAGDIPQR